MPGLPSDVDPLVRSTFEVADFFQLPDGGAEYHVRYGAGSKKAFEGLHRKLAPLGYTPTLTGPKEDCVLSIRAAQEPVKRRSSIPVILVMLSLVSVAAFVLLEREVYAQFGPGLSQETVVLWYGLGLAAVIGAHELGHRVMARRRREAPPTSYLIPGIPDVTSFLPVLGPLPGQKSPSVNRDSLFDVIIAGPLLVFAVAAALYLVGEFAWVQSSVPIQGCQAVNSTISVCQINPSVVQFLLDLATSPFTSSVAGSYAKLSPVADAAAVGFLLTFVGLLPIASFDGGVLATLAWGPVVSKAGTYLSALVLIAFDTPNYWAIAIIALILAGRQTNVKVLDEVSGVSSRRKVVLAAVVLLALLCVPIPQNLFTVPLP